MFLAESCHNPTRTACRQRRLTEMGSNPGLAASYQELRKGGPAIGSKRFFLSRKRFSTRENASPLSDFEIYLNFVDSWGTGGPGGAS